MLDKDDEFITTSEACEILQVSKTIIKRMADSGELETWKTPGGHRRIKRSSIEQKHQEQGVIKAQAETRSLKVMVVDDDAVIQSIFTSLVKDPSLPAIDIVSAVNGYEGLIKAGQGVFDMIFVDLNMPLMDGYEAIKVLREYENTKSSTIIVITADGLNEIDRERLPYDVVLMNKPLNLDVVKQFMQYEYALKKV
ncbi:response regulator [Thiomicrorhabdus lithotrophica]|uniref:Response regulator n=1 Tax=Thiomicrorhabdus lithotrophica TaxID=2949997 RepID=A0ABY8C7A0_9GAMM|nr:response regulator [Thiomicrorhabdus lithotrophica]WEJ61841.1 response regulator [Thiomicrorhabdus lithotrophica]